MIEFKEGDRIIDCSHKGTRCGYSTGYVYTFHKWKYEEHKPGWFQVKECLIASPEHTFPHHDYEKFSLWKWILYSILRVYFQNKDKHTRWHYRKCVVRTVSDYCRWKPFKKVIDAPKEYYSDLAKLDTYK